MLTFLRKRQSSFQTAALAITVAAAVGMADSFYLVLEYLEVLLHPGEPTPCTVNTLVSCTLTVQGAWGHYFPGVPNPLFGMLWYAGAATYGATRLLGAEFAKKSRTFVGFVLILGIAFSYRLYLASVLELGGVCPFCLASTTASTLILLSFCVDDAAYADRLLTKNAINFFYAFQIFSVVSFVIGLPLFIASGLRWIPQPTEVLTHWSFPVMVALVLIMAAAHAWAFRKMRAAKA